MTENRKPTSDDRRGGDSRIGDNRQPMTDDRQPMTAEVDAERFPRWRAIVILGLLGLALLWGLAVLALRGDVAVADADLEAMAGHIEAELPRGVVVVHPPWRDDVAARLRVRLPRKDVRLAAPVQEGAPRPPLALLRVGASPGPGGYSGLLPGRQARHGPLALELYSAGALVKPVVAPSTGRSLLLDDVAALKARVVIGDREVVCDDFDPAGPRYRCPTLPEWNHVGRRSLEIGGAARDCLWAHPITGGRIEITAPWPSGASHLTVWHGLADTAAAAPNGQPVSLEVRAGERLLERIEQKNAPGWNQHNVELGEEAADVVTFVITTPHDGARHFCIDARLEGP